MSTELRGQGRKSGGLTLIEILITLLILSVGLLGLAGMQTNALKNSREGFMRARAALLGSSLIERLRTDVEGAQAGRYNFNWICRPEEAPLRLRDWFRDLQASLGPAACAKLTCDNGGFCQVILSWVPSAEQADCSGDRKSGRIREGLLCLNTVL